MRNPKMQIYFETNISRMTGARKNEFNYIKFICYYDAWASISIS